MRNRVSCIAVAGLLLFPASASAHFLWITVSGDDSQPHVYFSNLAEPDDPDILDRLKGLRIWQMTADGKVEDFPTTKSRDSLVAIEKPSNPLDSAFGLNFTYGVITRGEDTFLLKYYAKTLPGKVGGGWKRFDTSKQLPLNIVPRYEKGQLKILVTWKTKPLADAQVVINGPGIDQREGVTKENGRFSLHLPNAGLYSIRVRHIEKSSGTSGGKTYATVRHYSTLAITVGDFFANGRDR